MPRKILVGKYLIEAQQAQMFEGQGENLEVISYGTPVARPSGMPVLREASFKSFIRASAIRELVPDRENIIEQREDGMYIGKSYVDNATLKGIIEFVGPEGKVELSAGYDQAVTLEELADITAFKYGNPSDKERTIFMDVNGQKVPVIEGEVTKEGLMDQYAQMQGYSDYKTMKETLDLDPNNAKYVPEIGDWN